MNDSPDDATADDYRPVDTASLTTKSLLRLIDYTLLKPDKTIDDFTAFIAMARKWGFRNVFLPPCYIPLADGMLSASEVGVGAPISFPYGYAAPEVKVAETVLALEEGAREIDMVMNISAAVSGEWDIVDEDIIAVTSAVRDWERLKVARRVPVKLILETPYLDDKQKEEACRRAVEAGMDYVKTATGLGPGGATVEDIKLMRRVVGDELGVKAAGGIRTWSDAKAMLEAGANRIGASAGPEIMEDFIRANT
ncbi:MAG TPA: deoxyribose-phosphate aldolase [Candidatus Anoxymicrobiaceae bacterium]